MTAAPVRPSLPVTRDLFPEIRERSDFDRRVLWAALGGACLLHLAALILPLPEQRTPPPPVRQHPAPRVISPVLVPPPIETRPPRAPRSTRRLPMLADSEAPLVEPLAEPMRDVETADFAEVLLLSPATAVAPPDAPDEVHDQWKAGLTLPVALDGRAQPFYPPLAVRARREGVVLLKAIITRDGEVASIEVLLAPDPDLGFSESAIDAVSRWKYEPGRLNGRAVAVSMTVRVDFSLR